jgi:hypothetical protein
MRHAGLSLPGASLVASETVAEFSCVGYIPIDLSIVLVSHCRGPWDSNETPGLLYPGYMKCFRVNSCPHFSLDLILCHRGWADLVF